MDETEFINRMEATSRQVLQIVHAQKMASVWAFDALLQTVEHVTAAGIRPAVIRALEVYQESAALSSDDQGDFREMVAEAVQGWVEHLKG